MHIDLNPEKCDGLGMCEAEAPELFEVDDAGGLCVLIPNPGEEHRASAEAACDACPTQALSITS